MTHGKNWRTFPPNIAREHLRLYDSYSHSLTTIDEEHRLVHDGMAFGCSYVHPSLANGASLVMHFKTGSIPPHIRACDLVLQDAPCTIELYRGATVTADGTAIAEQGNVNHLSSNTATGAIYVGPTVSANGTRIRNKYVPDMGGTGINTVGAVSSQFGEEQVFLPNTSYLLVITNNTGLAIVVGMEAFWYELSYLNE